MENLKILKLENSNQIQIPLCKFCYDRNFSKKRMSLVKYSVSISIVKTSIKVCYICRNLFLGTLPSIVNKILNSEILDQLIEFLLLILEQGFPSYFMRMRIIYDLCSKLKDFRNKNPYNLLIREKIRKNKKYFIDHLNPELKFDVVIEYDLNFSVNCKAKEYLSSWKICKVRQRYCPKR